MGGSADRTDGVSFVLLRLFDIASCCMIIEVMAIRFGHGFKDQRGYTFEYIVSGCGGCHGQAVVVLTLPTQHDDRLLKLNQTTG